jgi:Carboxypeptidase regulatory-like domain
MNDPRWKWWKEIANYDPKFEWKMPINFYGKVVDENGKPIQGAAVRFQWTDMSETGTTEKITQTDEQGMFSLTNEKGKRLLVFVSSAGYHAVNRGRASFEYAAFFEPNYIEPDSNDPVIFRMIKKGASEPLIQRGPILLRARNDGTSTNLDLTTARSTASGSGNLAVRISKGPSINNRFDWIATVEGLGGAGLIHSTDEFMLMAPADGYQRKLTFAQKARDEQYQAQMQTRFYVKTGDGKYARVEMRIIPEYNETAALDLTVYLNPSGSRNLEVDPVKVAEP